MPRHIAAINAMMPPIVPLSNFAKPAIIPATMPTARTARMTISETFMLAVHKAFNIP